MQPWACGTARKSLTAVIRQVAAARLYLEGTDALVCVLITLLRAKELIKGLVNLRWQPLNFGYQQAED